MSGKMRYGGPRSTAVTQTCLPVSFYTIHNRDDTRFIIRISRLKVTIISTQLPIIFNALYSNEVLCNLL
jgi:hypothetical protein